MGELATCVRLRSVGVGLLAAIAMTMTAMTALAAPAPGGASLSEVRVTKSGVTAILTARMAGGAKIDPASVKATIGGVGAPVSVQPIARERRVATLLIDTSGSMGVAGIKTVVHAAEAFLAAVPKDVYVGAVAFSTAPRVIATPTLDRAKVRAAVAALKARGETTLYDGLAVTLAQLGTAGDRSFVLVSDGGDTRSRRTLAQTLAALSASGVRAQVVGFKTGESQDSVLASLSIAGHGSVSAAGSGAAVSEAFVSSALTVAAQAFRSQIRVVIKAPPSVGGVRPLVVSANAGGKAFRGGTVVNLAAQSLPLPSASPTTSTALASGLKSPPQATSKGPLGVGWLLWLALLTVFLGVGGVVVILAMPTYVSRRQRQVQTIEGCVSDARPSRKEERSAVTAISASLVHLGDKVMDTRTSTPHTQLLLERADLPLRPGEWAVLRAVALVVGVAGGVVLMRGGSISTFIGSCLGGPGGSRRACSLPEVRGIASSQEVRRSAARCPDAGRQQSLDRVLAAAGARRRRPGRRRAVRQGVLQGPCRNSNRRGTQCEPGSPGRPDGQQQPSLDRHGHRHPTSGRR
ncbi:MAG: VWA domain-containing protein [Actinobacteria bacterium]|nr:VWA domain-containing protein [Actinomycetota bacterium]